MPLFLHMQKSRYSHGMAHILCQFLIHTTKLGLDGCIFSSARIQIPLVSFKD